MTEQPLAGGIANAGRVVRVGDTVRRPLQPFSAAIHRLLRHLGDVGFDGTPRVLGVDDRGREVLDWIPGDVPLPPYPAWSLTDDCLASVARLLRRFHEAVVDFDPSGLTWSTELADPVMPPGPVVHADVCPENVVFRAGQAVALLDFDFAAPGRLVWDVASTVRLWVPYRAPELRDEGRRLLDIDTRLRTFVDAYGLLEPDRRALGGVLVERRRVGSSFVRGRAEAGHPGFQEWVSAAGQRRSEQERLWLDAQRERVADLLTC